MKKLFGFLDRRPLIWFHYVLLVLVIFFASWLGGILGMRGYLIGFIWYYVWISLGDQVIHRILGVD